MKHMPKLRSSYSYQQYPRIQICNKVRKDLREKLKDYSINEISQPESKILDCMLSYFLEDKDNKEELSKLVKNYY